MPSCGSPILPQAIPSPPQKSTRASLNIGWGTRTGLAYAGMAFMTFGEKLYGELPRKADGLTATACAVKGLRRPRATWLRPELRVKVRHPKNGRGLRHASVRGIVP